MKRVGRISQDHAPIEKVDVGDLLDSSINGEVCPFMYMIWSGCIRHEQ